MEDQNDKNIKIETFGNTIKGWNRILNDMIMVCTFVLLLLLLLFSSFINVNKMFTIQVPLLVLEWVMLLAINGAYVLWHMMSYLCVNGKSGENMQNVVSCIRYMPFSMDEYFRWMHSKLKQTFWGIGFASFVISFVGCFYYGYYDKATGEYGFLWIHVQSISQVLYFLFVAFCETLFLIIVMHVWFVLFKIPFYAIAGRKKEEKKMSRGNQKNSYYLKKVAGIIVFVAFLVFALLTGKSILTAEDPIMDFAFLCIALVGICVKYWYFSMPILGLTVLYFISFMDRKMNVKENKVVGLREESVVLSKICKIRKFLWIFLLVAVLICGVPMLIDLCYQMHYGWNSAYVITSNIATLLFPAAILVLEIIMDFIQQKEKQEAVINVKKEIRPEENKTKPWSFEKKVSVALIIGTIGSVGIVISAFCYECFTLEGLEQRRLANVKTYTWDDVEACTLDADWRGAMIMQLNMKDGTEVSYRDAGVRYLSQNFEDELFLYDERYQSNTRKTLRNMNAMDYFNATETYYLWIAMELSERNVPVQADWEQLERDLSNSHDAVFSGIREITTGEGMDK